MQFDFVTIFPKIFDSYIGESILKRAQEKKLVSFRAHNIRDYTSDKHKTVDDTPYGGGVGMVMKVEPIVKCLRAIERKPKTKVVLLSARGKVFAQSTAKRLAKLDQIILVCGRYEGVDERVLEYVDEEISVGNYVLTGGELPALTIADAVTRLVPGVLGKDESSHDESHSVRGVLEYPQYTRPELWEGRAVPKILLSGNHADIRKWRESQRKKRAS